MTTLCCHPPLAGSAFACRRSLAVMRLGVWKRSSCHAVTRKTSKLYHTALQYGKRGILELSGLAEADAVDDLVKALASGEYLDRDAQV